MAAPRRRSQPREAKPIAKPKPARWKVPTVEMVDRWAALPFVAPGKREAKPGVGIILPVPRAGKGALAQVRWPSDKRRQARFIQAGKGRPHALSREEYLELQRGNIMTHQIIDWLLAAWAVRAARENEAGLAEQPEPERVLKARFAAQLVQLLLGRGHPYGEPQDILCRYLLSANYRQAVELATLERELQARPKRGTRTGVRNKERRYAAIRAVDEENRRKLPFLKSISERVDQVLLAHKLLDQGSRKLPWNRFWGRSTVRRALADAAHQADRHSRLAHELVAQLLAESAKA